jgi:cytoskeleton protein RodZ
MRETGLPSFGEKLKQEREKRKITLEQISVSTKIGTRMLQALEEDKFNQLPGGIFNKGFVRAYSRVVGLDENQTVAEYLQASGDAPPVRTDSGGREDEARENISINEASVSRLETGEASTRPLPWGLFAAVLLVIALALSFWSHRQRERTRQAVQPPRSETTEPSPASQLSSVPGNVSGGVSTEGSKTEVLRTGVSKTGAPKEDSGVHSPTSGSPVTKSASSAALKSPQGLVTAAVPGEFTLVIQIREESWISVTADGTAVASELLPAGSERSIHGRKQIVVRAGNAGGVDFHLNGKKLNTGGEYGEVKTVTFGAQGILPNTPTPPSTP